MFSIYHLIWFCICAIIIIFSLAYIFKKNVTLKKLLPICCAVSIISEIIKTLSVFKVVPSSDGTTFYPYLELQYFPLHMCSLLIFIIFYCTYGKNDKAKNLLLGFLYPASILGGILALIMPSIYSSVAPENSFISPLAYQSFLYHTMLVILGVTIIHDKSSGITSKNFKQTLMLIGAMGFISLYINSLFASPVYENSVLQSVEYTTNFFFTYRTPIGIKLETTWQWYLYLIIIAILAIVLIYLLYLPIFKSSRLESK